MHKIRKIKANNQSVEKLMENKTPTSVRCFSQTLPGNTEYCKAFIIIERFDLCTYFEKSFSAETTC